MAPKPEREKPTKRDDLVRIINQIEVDLDHCRRLLYSTTIPEAQFATYRRIVELEQRKRVLALQLQA